MLPCGEAGADAVELQKQVEGAGFGVDSVETAAEAGGVDLAGGERLEGGGGAVDEELVVGGGDVGGLSWAVHDLSVGRARNRFAMGVLGVGDWIQGG